jgi:hypothetical protein
MNKPATHFSFILIEIAVRPAANKQHKEEVTAFNK